MGKLKIILVSFNNLEAVIKTIDSIRFLTIDFGIAIVDSSTNQEIRMYVSTLTGCECSYMWEPRSGIYHAMNSGYKICNPDDLIWFLNPGDCLINESALNVLAGSMRVENSDWGFAQAYNPIDNFAFPYKNCTIEVQSLNNGSLSISHQAMFVRQSVLDELSGFDLRYQIAAYLDLQFKLLLSYRSIFVPIPMVDVDNLGFSHQHIIRTLFESALCRKRNGQFNSLKALIWFTQKFFLKLAKHVLKRVKYYGN